MLNSPQVIRLKLNASACFSIHHFKVCMAKQPVFSTNFPDQKDMSLPSDNATFASDCMFYQLLDRHTFSSYNPRGATLASYTRTFARPLLTTWRAPGQAFLQGLKGVVA